MLHKLAGLPTTILLLLLLLVALSPMPALCTRGRLGLHQLHPVDHHLHDSHTQMVIGRELAAPAPGHKALDTFVSGHKPNVLNMHPTVPAGGHKANVLNTRITAPGRNTHVNTGVLAYAANRNIKELAHMANVAPSNMGGCSTMISKRNPVDNPASLAKDCIMPSLRRSLLANHLSASDSDLVLQSGPEDLGISLAHLKAIKNPNIFGMLPRAHRVPPSGPSNRHNSEITEKPS